MKSKCSANCPPATKIDEEPEIPTPQVEATIGESSAELQEQPQQLDNRQITTPRHLLMGGFCAAYLILIVIVRTLIPDMKGFDTPWLASAVYSAFILFVIFYILRILSHFIDYQRLLDNTVYSQYKKAWIGSGALSIAVLLLLCYSRINGPPSNSVIEELIKTDVLSRNIAIDNYQTSLQHPTITSVNIDKVGAKQELNGRTYWPVRAQYTGTGLEYVSVTFGEQKKDWIPFQGGGEFAIFKDDFGEWKAERIQQRGPLR